MSEESITVTGTITTPACRWCKHHPAPHAGGAYVISQIYYECGECGAAQHAAFSLGNGSNRELLLWHNPDNSLFLEFQSKDGTTARYTLSAELLRATGVLQESDKPLNGVR